MIWRIVARVRKIHFWYQNRLVSCIIWKQLNIVYCLTFNQKYSIFWNIQNYFHISSIDKWRYMNTLSTINKNMVMVNIVNKIFKYSTNKYFTFFLRIQCLTNSLYIYISCLNMKYSNSLFFKIIAVWTSKS